MPRKPKQGRERVKGDDGRLYDKTSCMDAGKKAHENRVQTWLRRRKWTLQGYVGWVTSILRRGD